MSTETSADLNVLEALDFTPICEARAGYINNATNRIHHIEPPCADAAEWTVILHESFGHYTTSMNLCDRHLQWIQSQSDCPCGQKFVIATQRIGA
jgi:hypothetical protein